MIERSVLSQTVLNQICVEFACAELAFDIGISHFLFVVRLFFSYGF